MEEGESKVTIRQVKEDLREIRYYYAKQKELDGASRTVGASSITEKIERYHTAVRKAPVRLYDLYIALYVHNNTQLAVALDWDYSADYIRKLNNQLCQFLSKELEGGGADGSV